MKTITVKIPTSLKELRLMLNERSSKRYKHNSEVLNEFMQSIIQEVESMYWRKDISEYMKNYMFGRNGKIYKSISRRRTI